MCFQKRLHISAFTLEMLEKGGKCFCRFIRARKIEKKSKELKNNNYIYHNFMNLVYVCYGLQGGEEEAGDGDEKDEQTA